MEYLSSYLLYRCKLKLGPSQASLFFLEVVLSFLGFRSVAFEALIARNMVY